MQEKIGYLDGLRGVAALAVTLCHFFITFYPALMVSGAALYSTGFESLIYGTPLNVFYNGTFAVCVFFILSGYVLTYKFYASSNQEILRSGAIRRYFRLVPTVAFSIVCFVIVLIFARGLTGGVQLLTGAGLEGYFGLPVDIFSFTLEGLIGDFIGIYSGHYGFLYNNVLWTMQVEFIGSMIVFAFAALFGSSRNRWLFYLVVSVYFAGSFYLAFIIGALLADIINSKMPVANLPITAGRMHPLLVVTLTVTGLLFAMRNGGHTYYEWIYQAVPLLTGKLPLIGVTVNPDIIGASLILTAVLGSGLLQKTLSAKPFLFIGRVSFSMYVMHYMVFAVASAPIFKIMYGSLHLPYLIALAGTFIITAIALFFVSSATYRFVDAPGTRLSKKIYERYFSEENRFDWATMKKKIVTLNKTYFYIAVIVEAIVIIGAIGMFVIVRPTIDHNKALEAEQWYVDSLGKTEYSACSILAYSANSTDANSSIGTLREWIDGYEYRLNRLSNNSDELNRSGQMYMSYLADNDKGAVLANISYYDNLVNESREKIEEYEIAYNSWYWNNTVPDL